MSAIIRRDVSALSGPWHPSLQAYALAMEVMTANGDSSSPTSLAYHAAVHGFGAPNDAPPDEFRKQCQHRSWHFLPWHRWYLWYFERTVRHTLATLAEEGSVQPEVAEAWALPYWDPSRPGAEVVPQEFIAPQRWDGQPNPLRSVRYGNVNAGVAAVPSQQAAVTARSLTLPFSSPDPLVATFAGTEVHWQHFDELGGRSGAVEMAPHNVVHSFVGGNMLDFALTGLDPLFWLHHCNVDRWWEVRGHDADPTGWDNLEYCFRDVDGTIERRRASGCVDTIGALNYLYEFTDPPSPDTPVAQRRSVIRAQQGAEPTLPSEIVGVAEGFTLVGTSQRAQLTLDQPTEAFRTARGGSFEPERVYLTVDGVVGEVNPGFGYDVFLGEPSEETNVGFIAFFGIEASRAGHPLAFTFDVTDIVQDLRDQAAWDPDEVLVAFEPVALGQDPEDVRDTVPGIEVDAVSIVFK